MESDIQNRPDFGGERFLAVFENLNFFDALLLDLETKVAVIEGQAVQDPREGGDATVSFNTLRPTG